MKELLVILLATLSLGVSPASAQTLVGSGTTASFLVLEAPGFGAPLVYEYRYDYDPLNPQTTSYMLVAVDVAVTDLSFELLFGGSFLNSVTYLSLTLTNSVTPPEYSPFWAQWVSGGASGDPLASMPSGTWSEGYGPMNRTLAPGSWDGFIFNGAYEATFPYAVISPPPSVVPVPEPCTAVLFLLGTGITAAAWRRPARNAA